MSRAAQTAPSGVINLAERRRGHDGGVGPNLRPLGF